jgi:hypothetical protein
MTFHQVNCSHFFAISALNTIGKERLFDDTFELPDATIHKPKALFYIHLTIHFKEKYAGKYVSENKKNDLAHKK